MSEAEILKGLGIDAVDQDTIEKNVALGAAKSLRERDDERDRARLEKAEKRIAKLSEKLSRLEKRGADSSTVEEEYESALRDKDSILQRINQRDEKSKQLDEIEEMDMTQKLPGETEREFQIRTGKITPFANQPGLARETSNVKAEPDVEIKTEARLQVPAFDFAAATTPESIAATDEPDDLLPIPPAKRRKVKREVVSDDEGDYRPSGASSEAAEESDFELSESERRVAKRKATAAPVEELDVVVIDDGNEDTYKERYKKWRLTRIKARKNAGEAATVAEHSQEYLNPHPTIPDWDLEGNYSMPGDIHTKLFGYQKTCVRWLWELHSQNHGGILGDEMGLGKTVQIISFLAGLHHSNLLTHPILIVCPLTLMKQWVREFHKWWPPMRVAILHSSGSGMGGDGQDDVTGMSKKGKEIAAQIFRKGHVILTTYDGLTGGFEFLLARQWGYVILDEGHKIKNPDTSFTQATKSLKTHHRIILSGTPMQNNLKELWSLFDFVYPGRLGTLPAFEAEFETPIKHSQYADASEASIQNGIRCCIALKELISPYLLRRLKLDVAADLPKKTEKVILASITAEQRAMYMDYLESPEFRSVETGKMNQLAAIDSLRKICNHPDLMKRKEIQYKAGYGYWNRSGKMIALKGLVELIVREGHRTLLFAQTKQMLDILEGFMKTEEKDMKYLRLDGDLSVRNRDIYVNSFNRDESIKVFLLTTAVGGLGLNLIGANRVIIFDPDWNPSTDAQARERSYRLGQKKDVVIYRMLTKGTIEEKIFHRQIFKQMLSDMVFKDPTNSRKFTPEELRDIFTLVPEDGKDPKKSKPPTASVAVYEESSSELSDLEEIPYDASNEQDSNEKREPAMALLESVLGTSSDEVLAKNAASEGYLSRDAARFAERAKRNLEVSTKRVQAQGVHVPTWTGKSGAAGLRNTQSVQVQKSAMTVEEVRSSMKKFLQKNPNAPVLRVYNSFSGMVRSAGIKDYNRFLKEVADRRGNTWVLKG